MRDRWKVTVKGEPINTTHLFTVTNCGSYMVSPDRWPNTHYVLWYSARHTALSLKLI